MWIILIIVLVLIFIILMQYNILIKLRNKVKQSKSGIEVYLNQRFDLIPNLVECVKAYTEYEKDLLENIVQLRKEYNNTQDFEFKQAEQINKKLNGILAIAENDPELKASEQYLNLQKNLAKIESQLQAARRIYNLYVTDYNTKIQTVPTNVVAKIFRFQEEELFQFEE